MSPKRNNPDPYYFGIGNPPGKTYRPVSRAAPAGAVPPRNPGKGGAGFRIRRNDKMMMAVFVFALMAGLMVIEWYAMKDSAVIVDISPLRSGGPTASFLTAASTGSVTAPLGGGSFDGADPYDMLPFGSADAEFDPSRVILVFSEYGDTFLNISAENTTGEYFLGYFDAEKYDRYAFAVPREFDITSIVLKNRTEFRRLVTETAVEYNYSISWTDYIGEVIRRRFDTDVNYTVNTSETSDGTFITYLYNYTLNPNITVYTHTEAVFGMLAPNLTGINVKMGRTISGGSPESLEEECDGIYLNVRARPYRVGCRRFYAVKIEAVLSVPEGVPSVWMDHLNLTLSDMIYRPFGGSYTLNYYLGYPEIRPDDSAASCNGYTRKVFGIREPRNHYDFAENTFTLTVYAVCNRPFYYRMDLLNASLMYVRNITTYTVDGDRITFGENITVPDLKSLAGPGILNITYTNYSVSEMYTAERFAVFSDEDDSRYLIYDKTERIYRTIFAVNITIGTGLFNISMLITIYSDIRDCSAVTYLVHDVDFGIGRVPVLCRIVDADPYDIAVDFEMKGDPLLIFSSPSVFTSATSSVTTAETSGTGGVIRLGGKDPIILP